MKLLHAIKRWFRSRAGYSDCPACGAQSVRWHGENPIHRDGPPLIQYWRCEACHASTEIEPTAIVTQATRDLGYDDPMQHPLMATIKAADTAVPATLPRFDNGGPWVDAMAEAVARARKPKAVDVVSCPECGASGTFDGVEAVYRCGRAEQHEPGSFSFSVTNPCPGHPPGPRTPPPVPGGPPVA